MTQELQCYGEKLNSIELEKTLEHIFQSNDGFTLKNPDKRGVPICIWGEHGIGKTEVVRDYAKNRGWQFAYCAPAQFEEMGDLHGLPETSHQSDSKGTTVYLPPEWVPTTAGPGILLLDDFNRADIRILRGCMQLLQNFEMFSWSLPPRWQIVCTANPEGGDYSVTPMDDAMLTRLLHLTMIFDPKSWAAWAIQENIDPLGIDFVLTYPDLFDGHRNTARSFTHFLNQIRTLTNLGDEKQLYLLGILGKAFLDESVVNKFVHFVRFISQTLIQPLEILQAASFLEDIQPRLSKIVCGDGQGRRLDRLKTICTRLQLYLLGKDYTVVEGHKENLIQFLLCEEMDASLRFALHRELVNSPNYSVIRPLLQDTRLAETILGDL